MSPTPLSPAGSLMRLNPVGAGSSDVCWSYEWSSDDCSRHPVGDASESPRPSTFNVLLRSWSLDPSAHDAWPLVDGSGQGLEPQRG